MKGTRRARRASRHLFRLCLVDGALDESRVRHVAQAIAASGRRGAVALLTAFQRQVRLHRDRNTAIVESASPLSGDVRAHVAVGLERTYGARLATLFEDNSALIGGMRIKVGSDVYDGSVRARLAALEARL
jgi:F-type H+-transporting ATPase subunit delta